MCFWQQSKNSTTKKQKIKHKNPCRSRGLNPGPLAPKADALPLHLRVNWEYTYDLFISYLLNLLYQVIFYCQKVWNNNIIPKYIAKYAKKCIHDMYRINCWLPMNLGYCLPTMPTPFVIDILTGRFELLHSTGKLLTLILIGQ